MHSITYGIGYFLPILVINVFSSDYHLLREPNKIFSYDWPVNFYYKTNHDFLIMEIILKNISPSVTAVHLQYGYPYMAQKVNIEKPTNEVKFIILKHLLSKYIAVDVELYSQSKICGIANIAEGRDETTLTPYGYNKVYNYQYDKLYHKIDYCLVPLPCTIVVDLKNKCQESTLPDISCNIEKSQYICTITKQQYTMTFYQTYGDGTDIGPAPEMVMGGWKTTKLIIKLELFDNNTSVKIGRTKNKTILYKELSFTAEDITSEDYGNVTKLRYSETTYVEYRCQEPKEYATKYMHVGLINTTDNKITTHNTTLIQRKFKMADNGTILCCLSYVFTTDGKKMSIITRIVKNKTLLFYDSQESNFTESKQQTKAPLADWLIYLVPTFLGISVLMLALYIIIKQKHCCTNSQPVEETLELDNCATQNQVLYANLDLVRGGHQPESRSEESHYAKIIGSIHPLQ